ncbi:MAG: YicC family protein [Deltaproteobacteria bacterium]|nr:YicC family protein [Deltaproteobacteria bacterium]
MSLFSMTGYGFKITEDGYMIEMRSLNSKYLDINVKIPQELYPYEIEFRNIIKENFFRGSIELNISHKNLSKCILSPRLNHQYAAKYVKILNELASMGGCQPDCSSLLQIKDIVYVDTDEVALKGAVDNIIQTINDVCVIVKEMRKKEGESLKYVLSEHLKNINDISSQICGHVEKQSEFVRQNLLKKLSELKAEFEFDSHRLNEEVLYLISRMDIAEELDRVKSHIKQFESLINQGGQIGRILDFLCQEMLREFNTIGSKSTMIEIKNLVILGKDIVEKLREQVQNIE